MRCQSEPCLARYCLLLTRLWFFRSFLKRFRLVRSDSNSLDFQSLVHIEALFSIETFYELASGLSNRTADAGRIDLDSAALWTCFSVFIFQRDIVSIQNDLQTVS
jgi:hypothetical protein